MVGSPKVYVLEELTPAGRKPLAANKAAAEQGRVVFSAYSKGQGRNPCDNIVRQLWRKVRDWHLDPVHSSQHIFLMKDKAARVYYQ